MNIIAYEIDWDMTHLRSDVYDASLVRFEGWEYVVSWYTTRHVAVPEVIDFLADFSITQHSDFPCNDENWPLMSSRMIQIIRGVGDFPHRVIPVRLINRDVPRSKRHRRDGSLRPEVVDDRFAAVQLLQHIDVVDWQQSEFVRSQVNPEKVSHFDKLVLREPPGGLPPLFRVPANVGHLFASVATYEALQAAGTRGVELQPVYGTSE